MLRILNVFAVLDRGGAETMVMNYYRNIDRSRIQFDFVVNTTRRGAYEDEIEALGGRVFRVSRFNGLNIISHMREWQNLFKDHPEWNIIHVHFFKVAGIIFPIAKKMGFKRLIVHSHIASPQYKLMATLGSFVMRSLANIYATDRLACSADAGRYYFGERDFTVMNNAIDAGKFIFSQSVRDQKQQELHIDSNFVVGHVGRFNVQKNHTYIIDIFSEVYKCNSNSKLLLVGIGDQLQLEIESRVTDLNLSDSVIFLGSRPDIPELMQAMDVFLFPSLWEGLGIVAIEAQAAGLPTIVSDEVPDAAMITDLADKISLKESAGHWAKAVLKHNNGYLRRNMYDEVSQAGYDIHDNVKWLENFYLNE